ncbi:uncharacterized protein [Dysidea avara]|uniref:uncharacterized protein n=1 Tax=Dysidea avara TaxID=196820 RepID=UPI00332C67D8
MAAALLRVYLVIVSFIVSVNGNDCVMMMMQDDDSVELIAINESYVCYDWYFNGYHIYYNDTYLILDVNDSSDHGLITCTTVISNISVAFILPSIRNINFCYFHFHLQINILFIVMYILVIPITIANVCLHSVVRELRAIPGLLVMMISIIVIAYTAVYVTWNIHDVVTFNNRGYSTIEKACPAFLLLTVYLLYAYEAAKIAYFVHFVYIMYKSYQLQSQGTMKRHCILIMYVIFVFCTAAVCLVLGIIVSNPKSFEFVSHSCSAYNISYFLIVLAVPKAFVIITLLIGIVFYFKLSKICCKLVNIRVVITLALIAGMINAIGLTIFIAVQASFEAVYYFIPVGVIAEQVILFLLFLTSRNVRAKFSCKKRTTPTPELAVRRHV